MLSNTIVWIVDKKILFVIGETRRVKLTLSYARASSASPKIEFEIVILDMKIKFVRRKLTKSR